MAPGILPTSKCRPKAQNPESQERGPEHELAGLYGTPHMIKQPYLLLLSEGSPHMKGVMRMCLPQFPDPT